MVFRRMLAREDLTALANTSRVAARKAIELRTPRQVIRVQSKKVQAKARPKIKIMEVQTKARPKSKDMEVQAKARPKSKDEDMDKGKDKDKGKGVLEITPRPKRNGKGVLDKGKDKGKSQPKGKGLLKGGRDKSEPKGKSTPKGKSKPEGKGTVNDGKGIPMVVQQFYAQYEEVEARGEVELEMWIRRGAPDSEPFLSRRRPATGSCMSPLAN